MGVLSEIAALILEFPLSASILNIQRPSFQTICLTAISLFLSYSAVLITYRLYFSRIASFPGPFLAKTTHWYEFYHNCIKKGEYYLRIEEMHKRYGTSFLPQSMINTRQADHDFVSRTNRPRNSRGTSYPRPILLPETLRHGIREEDRCLPQVWTGYRLRRQIVPCFEPRGTR